MIQDKQFDEFLDEIEPYPYDNPSLQYLINKADSEFLSYSELLFKYDKIAYELGLRDYESFKRN